MDAVTRVTILFLISLFFSANIVDFASGTNGEGDCSKDGSCDGEEGNHGKRKYIIRGSLKLTLIFKLIL